MIQLDVLPPLGLHLGVSEAVVQVRAGEDADSSYLQMALVCFRHFLHKTLKNRHCLGGFRMTVPEY